MTAQSEVQTDETKFARQCCPIPGTTTRSASHEGVHPIGPAHLDPGTSRLGADSTGVARIPVPHIPAALVGRRPGGRPWAGGGQVGDAPDLAETAALGSSRSGAPSFPP